MWQQEVLFFSFSLSFRPFAPLLSLSTATCEGAGERGAETFRDRGRIERVKGNLYDGQDKDGGLSEWECGSRESEQVAQSKFIEV